MCSVLLGENRLEVRVLHSVLWSNSLGVVIPQHLVQEIERLVVDQALVLVVDELVPRFLGVLAEDVVVVAVESHVVLLDVGKQLICAKDFGNLNELVIVVLALEEWLLLEDHARKHAAQRPDVETVVIGLQVDEQLGSFEVSRGHSHIVVLLRVIELG